MSKPPLRTPEFVVLFSLVTSLTALRIDAMLPALQDMGTALAVTDPKDTQLIVTLFILGLVFGEIFFGPLSDAYGRKRMIQIGLLIFAVGTLVAMTADSLEQVLIGRIIQGIGGAGPRIVSRALIRDVYKGAAMERILSFIFMVFILFLVLAAVVAAWLGLRQPETLQPEQRIRFSLPAIASNAILILRHAKVMAYTVAAGFMFGALLLYLSTAQALFIDLYDVGEFFVVYFAILASGVGLASFLNSQLVMRYGMYRLSLVALGIMITFSSALLLVALQHDGVPPFLTFMALCFWMFFCLGLLFGNLNALAMESLGRVAGLGASIVASISSLISVVLAVVIGRFYDQTALPLAFSFILAGVISLVLVLAAHRSDAGEV